MRLRALCSLALKSAYFRATVGATVWSHQTDLSAHLGLRVKIDEGVIVGSDVTIGAYTYVNRGCTIKSGVIGRFCSIADGVTIGPTEHPLHFLSTHPGLVDEPGWGFISEPRPYATKPPPQIGNDVWIGQGAIVMRGVSIGDGAVVAAHAVVTHDIPPFAIAAGVPARVISYRLGEKDRARLVDSRWWEDEAVLRGMIRGGLPLGGNSANEGRRPVE